MTQISAAIIHAFAVIFVSTGAIFIFASFKPARKTRTHVPQALRGTWRVITGLIYFFFAGYVLFNLVLVSHGGFSLELVAAGVFLGGALFVFIIINLAQDSIIGNEEAERKLESVNESLEQRVADRTRELKSSNDFNQSILDSVNDSMAVIDVKTLRILGTNKAFLRKYGLPKAEVVGKTCQEIMHFNPERCDASREVRPLTDTAASGVHARVERIHVNDSGERRYVEVSATPVRNEAGKIVSILHVERDVTERKQAEDVLEIRALQQTAVAAFGQKALQALDLGYLMNEAVTLVSDVLEVEYCKVLELLPDGNSLILKAGTGWKKGLVGTATVSAGHDSQAGFTLLSEKPVIVDDLSHEPRFKGPQLLIDHAVTSGLSVVIPGRERPFGVLGAHTCRRRAFTNNDCNFIQAIANILAEALERKRAEQIGHESERKLRAITDTAADAILMIDDRGRIMFWNPASETMFGYRADEAMEKDLTLIIPHRYREAHKKAFSRSVDTGGITTLIKNIEIEALRKDGSEIPVEISISGVLLKGKRYSVGLVRDISERKRLEAQLLHSQKMEAIGELTGGIAHDFNNILSAIVGYGHILQMRMGKDDPLLSNVVNLLESADRAAHLTQSLLAFGRKQLLKPRHTDLNEIVQRVEKLMLHVLREDIKLTTVFGQRAITINADGSQIEQVLINLATNARDAMPNGGSFTFETGVTDMDETFVRFHGYGKPGKYAVVSAQDTGVGMDEATRKRIFEPFFTTKEVGKGTGLGLAIVYGIVKQHQGYISVYSEPGKGTRFMIYLPLVEKEVEERDGIPAASEEELPGGTETVLVAEDDETLRSFSKTLLENVGYTVLVAVDGEDAVNKFRQHQETVRLAIIDMIMPGKSGKEAYEEIRRMKPGIKVLFVSGYTADRLQSADLQSSGVELLQKPIPPRVFIKKVREVLDKKTE